MGLLMEGIVKDVLLVGGTFANVVRVFHQTAGTVDLRNEHRPERGGLFCYAVING